MDEGVKPMKMNKDMLRNGVVECKTLNCSGMTQGA